MRIPKLPTLSGVMLACLIAATSTPAAEPLTPGNHTRKITVDGRERSHIVFVPKNYVAAQPAPVVLALHGAGTNGAIMALLTGLNRLADDKNFVVVYPNGTGLGETLLTWNAGKWNGRLPMSRPDDVKYLGAVLDDVAACVNVDDKRIYATGLSNGGMMSYRLAAEMSDRIAAIAPVAGTLCLDDCRPTRPVPVLHFHGLDDRIVPFAGPKKEVGGFLAFKSVDDSIAAWCKLNGCSAEPQTEALPNLVDDGTTVTRKTFGPGTSGAEVVLIEVAGGGHTWPGRKAYFDFLGRSTSDISANEMLWEFFERHPQR